MTQNKNKAKKTINIILDASPTNKTQIILKRA